MRSEFICHEMPSDIPGAGERLIVSLLMACTIIGIFLIPIYLINARNSHAKDAIRNLKPEAEALFKRFIGKEPNYMDVSVFHYTEGFRANGLAYSDGKIYVMQAGYAAEFEWDEIRRWSYNIQSPDTLIMTGGDLSERASVAMHNAQNGYQAKKNSGFTVEVANIDAPSWTCQTSDKKICKKWMEIMSQLSEGQGRLAA